MNAEIERAFGHNGFPSMQTFGAFDGAAFDPNESRDVIFVARLQPASGHRDKISSRGAGS